MTGTAQSIHPEFLTAIYTRISEDRQQGAGVRDQYRDCLEFCQRHGWDDALHFEDNDISASGYARKKRPRYRAMLARIEAGEVRRIVVAHIDRLYRQPKELEELIDLADRGRVEIVSVYSGPVNLSSSDGRTVARVQIAMAAKASDDTSRRVLRAKQRTREEGRSTGGSRPFGWLKVTVTEPDGSSRETWDPMQHDPAEADVIRQAVDAVIAGASLTSIARQWNEAGVSQPKGSRSGEDQGPRWNTITIRRILTSPRNAGLVPHAREVRDQDGKTRTQIDSEGPAVWPAIIDRAKWERCREVLDERGVRWANPRRRSLLTGLLVCGICGASLTTSVHSIRNPDGSTRRVWRCSAKPGRLGRDGAMACGRVVITADRLEQHLIEATFDAVDNSDVGQLMAARAGDDGRATDLMRDLADVERSLRELADSLGAGRLSVRAYEQATSRLEDRQRALQGQYSSMGHTSLLWRYAGRRGTLREAWMADKLTADEQHAAIKEAIGQTAIMPATRRGRGAWDTDRIVPVHDFVPIRMRPLSEVG
jgi:site-specific DNA recombinase